jgi:hypothetical protein
MTSRNRTLPEKVGDWGAAFNAMRDEITPPVFREIMTKLTSLPAPPEGAGLADFNEYITAVNASLGIARIVAANDRAAAMAAAIITQSGVVRPTVDISEDGEA